MFADPRTPSLVLHACDQPSMGQERPRIHKNTNMVIHGGETRLPGKTPKKKPYHHQNRFYHSGSQRPHLLERPRRRQEREELHSPGRWFPNSPCSCHRYTDRNSYASFPAWQT
ncbi:unnamed protein product [Ectocarpus sp. 4 AP-2014]